MFVSLHVSNWSIRCKHALGNAWREQFIIIIIIIVIISIIIISAMSVRLIITCLTIASVFTLCWVPLQTTTFTLNVGNFPRQSELLRWLTIFSCFNSCVNPIIYGLMWRPFRTALRDVSSLLHIIYIYTNCGTPYWHERRLVSSRLWFLTVNSNELTFTGNKVIKCNVIFAVFIQDPTKDLET